MTVAIALRFTPRALDAFPHLESVTALPDKAMAELATRLHVGDWVNIKGLPSYFWMPIKERAWHMGESQSRLLLLLDLPEEPSVPAWLR